MNLLDRIFEAARKLDQTVYQKLGLHRVVESIRPKLPPSLARFGGMYIPMIAVVTLIALSAVALSGTTGLSTATAGDKIGRRTSDPEAAAAAEEAAAAAAETAAARAASEAGTAKGGAAAGAAAAVGGALATGRGITDSTITIGVMVLAGVSDVNTAYGYDCGAGCAGDNTKQAQAVIDYINANGGVAKRKLIPIFHEVDIRRGDTTFDVFAQEACTKFTEDNRVFAVIDVHGSGFYEQQLISCLAKRDTPRIGYTEVDQKFADDYAPHFYSPSFLNLTRGSRALVTSLVKQEFFQPTAKIGLIHYDDPPSERAAEQGIKKTLSAHGLKVNSQVAVSYLSRISDLGAIGAQVSNAVLRFNSENITHVLIQDRQTLTGLFMQNAEGQRYRPWYGLTSMSMMGSYQRGGGYDEQVRKVRGVGWRPNTDVHYTHFPPSNSNKRLCVDILTKADQPTPDRDQKGLSYCDGLFFLKVAGDSAKSLNTVGFRAAAEGIGTGFEPPLGIAARFGPGFHDGASMIRPFALNQACTCFEYVGEPEPID